MSKLTDQQLADLIAEYHALDAQRADISSRCEQIKSQIRDGVRHLGKHETDAGPVTVFKPRKFDAEVAEKVIPDTLLPVVQKVIPAKTVIDQSLCKENLSPALYRRCTVEGDKASVRFA